MRETVSFIKALRLQSFLKSKLLLRDDLLRREKTKKVSQDFEKFLCKIEHYDQDKEVRMKYVVNQNKPSTANTYTVYRVQRK